MLSEKHLQLLTAYVDGELTGRQRRRVERLAQKSPAARKLLHELGMDSRQLAALPRKLPPRDLPRRVLRQTATVPAPVPATPSTLAPAASAGMPSWMGLALAASVLIVITALSYWYFADQNSSKKGEDRPPVVQIPPAKGQSPKIPSPKVGPAPRMQFVLGDLLSDLPKMIEFRKQLVTELAKETSVEIALTTPNAGTAVKNLEKVLNNHAIKLLIDAKVHDRIKQGKKALLYVEDLYPKEIADILKDLAIEQKPASPVVEMVALHFLSAEKRADLGQVLGLSPKQLEPAKKTAKAGLPPESPVIPIIIADPKKPDDKANPQNNVKPQQQFALLVAYEADGGPALAPDHIKSFHEARKGSRPDNTVQLVIVLSEVPA